MESRLLGAGRAFLQVGVVGTGVPQPEKVSSRQTESKGTPGKDRTGKGTGPRVPRRVSRALGPVCVFVDWARRCLLGAGGVVGLNPCAGCPGPPAHALEVSRSPQDGDLGVPREPCSPSWRWAVPALSPHWETRVRDSEFASSQISVKRGMDPL